MTTYKYSTSELEEAVASSTSVSDVMRKLGIRVAGGSHRHLSNRIKREGIPTDHFTGQAHRKGSRDSKRKTAADIFVVLPEGSRRPAANQLRRALTEIGVPYACTECGIDEWRGKPITLHVDHIDGDWLNNLPGNLRYLCLNCHSQTPTFGNQQCPRRESNP